MRTYSSVTYSIESASLRNTIMTRLALAMLAGLLLTGGTYELLAQDRTGPFTHAPRSVRSRDVDQRHVRLDLRLDWDKQEVQARAAWTLGLFQPLRSVVLDAAGMHITAVRQVTSGPQAGKYDLQFESRDNKLTIRLEREHAAGETLQLEIDYVLSKPRHGLHFVIPDDAEPHQPRMAWTQGEPEYAHYWFPCIDSPADRVTSEILATVPGDYVVLSNGVLESKQKNENGTQTWHWRQADSHVPYLLSVVAGKFETLEQKWEDIPVVSYVPTGRLADAPRSFDKTPAMVDFFSRQIGVKYPWPKYTQICVDEYGWGGMEHTSATTLNLNTLHDERAHLDVSSDNLVAHELAHQWFGDLLTCKDWGEIWLNESFATYFATLWAEHDRGSDQATWDRYEEANEYLGEDKRYRRSIVNYRYDDPNNVFDSHAYPKGGRVLHMLRFVLGDELFWKSIRHYTERNRHRTVETADLRIAIEEVTGQGLNWFFDQWVHHGGHPDFRVQWHWDEATKMLRVEVQQTQKVDAVTPLFRTPVEIEIATGDSHVIRRVEVSKADETFHLPCEERPTRVCFDPRDWILKTLDAPKSKEELLDQLARDEHLLCRVRAAQGLAEFKEDDDARDALTLAAQRDAFWAVRQEAVKSLTKFSGDKVRDTLLHVAAGDAKSYVRREAIKALAQHKHAQTNEALRRIIAEDQSYFAVADALRTLEQIDHDHCADDLLRVLETPSHDEVVLRAAIDGLVKLKQPQAAERLTALLRGDITPQRRSVLTIGLARLKPDDADALQQLYKQLDNDRLSIRRATIDALADLGNPAAIEVLLARRNQEELQRAVRQIDEAVAKLREKGSQLGELQKEVESLRAQNKRLEERLQKLENPASN